MAYTSKICRDGTLHLVKIPGEYKEQVGKTAQQVFVGASELFAYSKPVETVIFSSDSELVIPEVGTGAHATFQGDIVVNVDFSRQGIKTIISKELPSTLYHEFSHIVRKSVCQNLYETLLESLVTEGIACYIEYKVFRKKVLYAQPIKNEMKYWKQAQKSLRKKTYDHDEWFFGRGRLPRWIGYRLGYLLVEGYMRNKPKTSLAVLVRLDAATILRASGM